ncbi:hypothetical protein GGI12_000449 [Dipsacomyces acuminosporus]|nr:hypothetical protein GGI12_000449 [Dipsacomyces acuminosporus]
MQLQQNQQFTFVTPGQQIRPTEPTAVPPPIDTLFDANEESYLQSFLNSFDVEGFGIGSYLNSPPPMANFSSHADLTSMGMGMGMGVGASMMGAMDDAIPHLSLDENAHDTTQGFSHINAPSNHISHTRSTAGDMVPMHRQKYFDYGLGNTQRLSLGNVMSEELHKVSSWLIQNQDHQSEAPLPSSATFVGINSQQQHQFSLGQLPTASPANEGDLQARGGDLPPSTAPGLLTLSGIYNYNGAAASITSPPPKPSSESEMSIKRKASHEQIDQPRKTRGHSRPPLHEAPLIHTNVMAAVVHGRHSLSPVTSVMSPPPVSSAGTLVHPASAESKQTTRKFDLQEETDTGKDKSGGAGSNSVKRRDSKKGAQRVILTEEERRANHIASEQRRRNQIRQGYAELMSLVTTLRDPALGNHPGTAQSTPSKAVILSHAVQFIRGLEEGNRILRKRLEGTRHILPPPMHLAAQTLSSTLHPHSPSPPQ